MDCSTLSICHAISERTGIEHKAIADRASNALDYDMLGERLVGSDDTGVYMEDISNACGEYTLKPIPYEEFVSLLRKRICELTSPACAV